MSRKERHFQGITREIRNFSKIIISENFFVSNNFVSEGKQNLSLYIPLVNVLVFTMPLVCALLMGSCELVLFVQASSTEQAVREESV